jgi:xanthine/uracil permease
MSSLFKLVLVWVVQIVVTLVLIGAGQYFGVEWIWKISSAALAGQVALIIALVVAQFGYSLQHPLRSTTQFMLTMNVVMSGVLKEIPLVLGLVLGTVICYYCLKWSNDTLSPQSDAV